MSCYGNAGAGSLIPIPGTRTFNNDVTLTKVFPLESERRQFMFRAEAYNVFNHTQFTGATGLLTGPDQADTLTNVSLYGPSN
jgi:hypothetical protein